MTRTHSVPFHGTRRLLTATLVLGLAAMTGLTGVSGAAAAPAAKPSWRVDLGAGSAERNNTQAVPGGITLKSSGAARRSSLPGSAGRAGSYLAPGIRTDRWVSG